MRVRFYSFWVRSAGSGGYGNLEGTATAKKSLSSEDVADLTVPHARDEGEDAGAAEGLTIEPAYRQKGQAWTRGAQGARAVGPARAEHCGTGPTYQRVREVRPAAQA